MALGVIVAFLGLVVLVLLALGVRALIRRSRRRRKPLELVESSASTSHPTTAATMALSNSQPKDTFAASEDYRGFGSDAEAPRVSTPPPTDSLIKRRGRHAYIEGEARHVQRGGYMSEDLDTTGKNQATQGQSLNFRLLVRDKSGREVRQYDVQLRGLGITGSIQNGDMIAVPAKFIRDDVCEASYVYNRRTGAVVSADSPTNGWRTFFKIVLILAILGGLASFIASHM